MMSDKIIDTEIINENEEITIEDLDGVAGGKAPVYKKKSDDRIDPGLLMLAYGAPLPSKTFEEALKEIKKKKQEKEKEKEINQVSDLGADESSLNQ